MLEGFGWEGKSLAVWSERAVVALPDGHSIAKQDVVCWKELARESLLLPQRGPGPEYFRLICRKLDDVGPIRVIHHDVTVDRLLTLVGAGFGIVAFLEGATGASYPGVTFRELHDSEGPTRMNFRALWREDNPNPSLHPFLDMLRERYPDLFGEPAPS